MLIDRRRFGALLCRGGIALSLPGLAASREPLKMIVGFAAGGTADVMARALAEGMRAADFNVVVDNRPGAGGRIGTEALMAAPPDGNTLLLTPSTNLTLFPHIHSRLRYKLEDLAIVGAPANVQFGLAVSARHGPKSLAEFLERARRDPKDATYGMPGAGSVMQLLGDLLAKRAGVPLTAIPYKGGSAALTDVIGGTVAAALTALPNLMAMHREGKVRILAVTSEEPLPALSGVATFKSAGYPELSASEYMCVVVRREVPPRVLADLRAAVAAAAKAPDTVAAMEGAGFQTSPMVDPAALGLKLAADSTRWQAAVRETGFKPAE